MAALFHSIEELKTCVSGAVDNDDDFLESIESDINNAALVHICPWLGDDLYNHIVGIYPDAAPDSPEAVLTEKIQKALAPLALYHASKTKTVRFGTHGMSQNEKPAFRYQENEYRMEMLNSGYEYLELLLKYLEDNVAYYTEGGYLNKAWAGKQRHFSRILRYASEFRQVSAYRISRYTFEILLPMIEETEFHAIEKNLPSSFLYKLKTNLENEDEKHALWLIKSLIAELLIVQALRRQLVTMENGQLVQNEHFGDQASSRKTIAPLSMTEKAHTWEQLSVGRNWMRLKSHLADRTSVFPLLFHTSVGGTNADTDAWGYEPPVTVEDTNRKEEQIERWKNSKVVGL
jgi:hypothetical protein